MVAGVLLHKSITPFVLFAILLSSALGAADTLVTIISPTNGQDIGGSIDYSINYSKGDLGPASTDCTLYIGGRAVHTTTISDNSTYTYTSDYTIPGTHTFEWNCTANNSGQSSFTKTGTPPTINLDMPADSYSTEDTTIDFAATYNSNDCAFTDATCTLYIDGSPDGSETFSNSTQKNITAPSLSRSSHTWQINCTLLDAGTQEQYEISSTQRSLTITTPAPTGPFFDFYLSRTEAYKKDLETGKTPISINISKINSSYTDGDPSSFMLEISNGVDSAQIPVPAFSGSDSRLVQIPQSYQLCSEEGSITLELSYRNDSDSFSFECLEYLVCTNSKGYQNATIGDYMDGGTFTLLLDSVKLSDGSAILNITDLNDKYLGQIEVELNDSFTFTQTSTEYSSKVYLHTSSSTDQWAELEYCIDAPPYTTLLSPSDGHYSETDSVILTFRYNKGHVGSSSTTCDIYIDDALEDSQTISDTSQGTYTATGLASGSHKWQVICKPAESSERFFTIKGDDPSVELITPSSSYSTKDRSAEFSFVYHKGDSGNTTAACGLYIDGIERSSVQVSDSVITAFTQSNLEKGLHTWYVRCGLIQTDSRSFEILAGAPATIQISSPADSAMTSNKNPEFSFLYNSGDDAPTSSTCVLLVDGEPKATKITASSKPTSISTSLDPGTYQWSIVCNKDTEFEVGSSSQKITIFDVNVVDGQPDTTDDTDENPLAEAFKKAAEQSKYDTKAESTKDNKDIPKIMVKPVGSTSKNDTDTDDEKEYGEKDEESLDFFSLENLLSIFGTILLIAIILFFIILIVGYILAHRQPRKRRIIRPYRTGFSSPISSARTKRSLSRRRKR